MEISQENLHLHLQTAIRDLLEKTIKNHQEVTRGHISWLLKIKGFYPLLNHELRYNWESWSAYQVAQEKQ